MRKLLPVLCLFLAFSATAQRRCGIPEYRRLLIAKDPSIAEKLNAQRASLQQVADNYLLQQRPGAFRTTASASPIPVIFHIMVTASQLDKMGGYDGVAMRCDSQITVLNRDYNRENADSSIIPCGWKPLYASVGIHFGLAHTGPMGWSTPGYDIRIIDDAPGGFNQGANGSYAEAKHNNTGGLDAWDETKYLNVWCFNFVDIPTNLGFTVSRSDVSWAPANEVGVCLNYLALGTASSAKTLNFPSGGTYNKGRTMTHECGHFFEIWHTWGDDGPGKCPWNGGADDGIADTPPEADAKYGIPTNTITCGTIYDACKDSSTVLMQPYGVASLDFMNYTDDPAMVMFTTQQAAVMASMVATGGESYSLTQHPELLLWPANAGVGMVNNNIYVSLSPNPTTGVLNIVWSSSDELKNVSIINTIGQEMTGVDMTGKKDHYSIDLSGMSKGIYFVRCNFASGNYSGKILLQ